MRRWQRACRLETYLANRSRMQRLAFYSRDRLHQIADRCPVKQTLQRGLVVETVTGMPEGPPSVG